MNIRIFKYLSPFLIYYGAIVSFLTTGFVVWLPLVYSWFIIPVLELILPVDESNLTEAEEELARKNKWYDYFLWMIVPLQFVAMGFFFYTVTYVDQPLIDTIGKTLVMGQLCGVLGINV